MHVSFISLCHLKAKLIIEVLDQGPGIEPEDREKIFQPYFSKTLGGQGLGLNISQRISEKLGGTIKHFNLMSGGSAFAFSQEVQKPIFGVQQVFKFERTHGRIKPMTNRVSRIKKRKNYT